jgi:hypothetical protein
MLARSRKLNDLGTVGAIFPRDLSHAGERLEKDAGRVGSATLRFVHK